MRIIILNILSIQTYLICITNGHQNYELEFLDEGIFKRCEKYPDNFTDLLFDLSNTHIEQTSDGSLLFKGTVIIKNTVQPKQPHLVEIFKKERGTWQPTHMSLIRPDFCTAAYGKNEFWNPYLKNTPEDQQKCPFTEGQRVDFDISEPTIFSIPTRNAEGEYNIHVEIGHKDSDFFLCCDIFVMMHNV